MESLVFYLLATPMLLYILVKWYETIKKQEADHIAKNEALEAEK
jgi:hypothetical protein